MFWIILLIALGFIVIERLWPANQLPQVESWWSRIVVINLVQLGILSLVGSVWEHWLVPYSLFHLARHVSAWVSGLLAYLLSTFVYYWWHRYRHESQFFWRVCHQLHHSARRIEIVTSFYKHPVEIFLNALLGSALIYFVLGCSPSAAAICSLLSALAEFFYHWNVRTPRWLGFIVQRPESHRIHHQIRHHTNNFADLPMWDALFGTLQNAIVSPPRCGFDAERERQFDEMLRFQDVHEARTKISPTLDLLPTCLGCRKRWACAAVRSGVGS